MRAHVAALVLAAVALAGCAASPGATDGPDRSENRYESAEVTDVGVVRLDRSLAAEVTLRAGLFCPDTERRRFTVRGAFVGRDTVLGWAENTTMVPATGNASVLLRLPPHVDASAMELVRIQAYRNESRSAPACSAIAEPGEDDPTVETRFVANVTDGGFGPVGRAPPPEDWLRS